eukprot:TRINITY_DN1715_c0_g5_i1.p1 TRINITY_DN1715_c0_g5~~TRINITY_DN1715_c0_g5_i1.p1  ORF type:complete len:411 (-),score=50.13 TRINITY_DN1715_c0_g5_i1:93-1325(-)
MGFDAIWISPIVENSGHVFDGYHGYYTSDFYGLNLRFGTEEDLHALIEECHRRNIWVMFDVVANHVAPVTNNTDYSPIKIFNDSKYFHPFDQIRPEDYGNNQERVENCWLANLPDLNQSIPFVRKTLLEWINWLVKKYKIDGIRIDTAAHVPKDFWDEFCKSAAVFSVGEITVPKYDYQAGYVKVMDSILNFMLHYKLVDIFARNASMTILKEHYENVRTHFPDPRILGTFLDNHDQPRLLSRVPKVARFKCALILTILTEGIPYVYAGSEQGFNGGDDPFNREPVWTHMNPKSELYEFVTKVIHIRKSIKAWEHRQVELHYGDNIFIYSIGETLIALTNSDSGIHIDLKNHPFKVGDLICNALAGNSTSDCLVVHKNFGVTIRLSYGEPKIYTLKRRALVNIWTKKLMS